MDKHVAEIQDVLKAFQDGYAARDITKLDEFMELFLPTDEVELIGIGASSRNQNEWFQGREQIREIIESDWKYWGDVRLKVKEAKITVKAGVAWLSTSGFIFQTENIHTDEVTGGSLNQMIELLNNQTLSPKERLIEASHFGIRRWREREKQTGYPWPFVFTAVLVHEEGQWRFHTIHWSMPVD